MTRRSRPRGGTRELLDGETTETAAARTGGNVDTSGAMLLVLLGASAGQRFTVGAELVLGRGQDCGAVLDDDGVSRRHARLCRNDEGQLVVQDLGSRNGTFVNGRAVDTHTLDFGDKIALGTETLLLVARHDAYEEQLRQAQKLQALGQLASGVAHDFNNILGALLANVTYVATKEHDAETTLCLADMQSAVHRGVELTRQLSAFSRRAGADHVPVALRDVVVECAGLLRRTLGSNVGLRLDLRDDSMVLGDASRLSQVLMNLCINARDALRGGGEITVSTALEGEQVVLSVSDTGPGIDAATQKRLFEPFFTTKPRGKGTGLGLTTVQTIIQEHRGKIGVRSTVGAGATFSARIPRLAAAPSRSSTTPTSSTRTVSRISTTVLVADDDELIRDAAARVIASAGGRTVLAADGAEALRVYTEHAGSIGAVVLDLDMPNVDGTAVLRVLRSFDQRLPIFIASGHRDKEREAALMADGATGILPKPFDAPSLVRTLAGIRRITPSAPQS